VSKNVFLKHSPYLQKMGNSSILFKMNKVAHHGEESAAMYTHTRTQTHTDTHTDAERSWKVWRS
jgi:hypothetical protein